MARLVIGSASDLEAALFDQLQAAHAEDSEASKARVVLCQDMHVAQILQRRFACDRSPLWGVRFLSMGVYARLAIRRTLILAGRSVLTSHERSLLLASLVLENLGKPFEPVKETEGFRSWLSKTLGELEREVLRDSRLEGLLPVHLQNLLHRWQDIQKRHARLSADQSLALASNLLEGAAPDSALAVQCSYGLSLHSSIERRLLTAITTAFDCDHFLLSSSKDIEFWAKDICSGDTQELTSSGCADIQTCSAAHAHRSVDAVVSELKARLTSDRLSDAWAKCAIYTTSAKHASLARAALERAQIPIVDLHSRSLSTTDMGRALEALILQPPHQWTRRELVASMKNLPWKDPDAIGVDQWSDMTKEAKCARGLDTMLELWRSHLRSEVSGPLDALLKSIQRLRGARHASGASDLFDAWSHLTKTCLAKTPVTDTLLSSLEATREALVRHDLSLDVGFLVKAVLDASLPSSRWPETPFVFLAPAGSLRGVPMTWASCLDLNEGLWPKPPVVDSVFGLGVRARLNLERGTSFLTPERLFDEQAEWTKDLQGVAGGRLVLSCSRMDVQSRKALLPSQFLSTHLSSEGDQVATSATVPLFPWESPGLKPFDIKAAQMSQTFSDTALHGSVWPTRLKRYLDAKFETPKLTVYDGVLREGSGKPLAKASASSLATFFTCPYRYHLQYDLGLREDRALEELLQTPADVRGKILHETLRRFYQNSSDVFLTADPDLLHRNLDDTFVYVVERFQEEIPHHVRSVFMREKDLLRADLHHVLSKDIRDRHLWEPWRFEEAFGMDAQGAKAFQYLTEHGIISFRGQIDRLDRSRSGKGFRVIDYKTGRRRISKKAVFGGGKGLQLPLYLLACRELFQETSLSEMEGQYIYTSLKHGVEVATLYGSDLEARMTELDELLGTFASLVHQGVYFQNPGRNQENCTYCWAKDICHPTLAAGTHRRKQEDPHVQRFHEIESIS